MHSLDDLVKKRPYERYGTRPGESVFAWSNERESDPGVQIPDGLTRFREIVEKPIEIFSQSTPIEFQFIEDLPGSECEYPQALFLLEFELERPNAILEERKAAQEYFAAGGGISREKLPKISAERDEIEKQVLRVGEKVRDNAGKTSEILLAWISEALFTLGGLQGEAELEVELSQMYAEVKFFWERFVRGFPLTETCVRQWLPSLLSAEISGDFVNGQINGLFYFASHRDKIIRKCLPLNDRRVALESVLHSAITELDILERLGESNTPTIHSVSPGVDAASPVEASETLEAGPRFSDVEHTHRKPDRRIKDAHRQREIVAEYYRLLQGFPDAKQAEIFSKLIENLDIKVGERQILRYIETAYKSGKSKK